MDLPDLHFRRRLLATGWTDGELQRRRRRGDLTSIRRGAYLADPVPSEVEAKHVLLVRAVLPHLAPGSVISHASAAAVRGLPLWNVPTGRVQVTRPGSGGGRITRGVHLHVGPLEPDEIEFIDGIPVASGARIVLDVARTLPFEQAVVIADAALRTGLVTPSGLLAAQQRCARWRGGPQALRVIRFADGRAVNPGESRSRVAISRAGLPTPELQYEVRSADGRFLGFGDFGWPQFATIGEFDGKVKYAELLRPGQNPGDVVFEEKIREDAIRAERVSVARWVWREIDDFDPVADRIRGCFERSLDATARR